MEVQSLLSSIGLVAGLIFLPGIVRASFAVDRPIHSSIVALAVCGACIIGLGRTRAFKDIKSHRNRYAAIPLEEADRAISSDGTIYGAGNGENEAPMISLRRLRWIFIVLVAAICARVEVLHQVVKGVQCTRGSYQPYIPFLLAVYDFVIQRRHPQEHKPDGEQDGNSIKAVIARISANRYTMMISTLLLGLCSVTELSATAPPPSTYICAITLPAFALVPTFQIVGLLLDFLIIALLFHILELGSDSRQHHLNSPRIIGWAFLSSAVIWTTIGAIIFLAIPEDRRWMLTLESTYLWSLSKLTLSICITVLFALPVSSRSRAVPFSVLVVFTLVGTTILGSEWGQPVQKQGFSDKMSFIALVMIFVADILYAAVEISLDGRSRSSTRHAPSNVPRWVLVSIPGLVIFPILLGNPYLSGSSSHPIDLLISNAQTQHELWKTQAFSSKSLGDAVENYRKRYKRNPPPHFDIWYEYATSRSSMVIDDYDNIFHDLLPYWSMSPAEIRQRTWDIIANPWNDAGGIHIRAGSLELSKSVPGTHRWMVDGVAHIIEPFAEWLPDMDLAFNLNDEARISVPWEVMEPLRKVAERAARAGKLGAAPFSNDRASGWASIPENPIEESSFQQRSFTRTFYDFGAVGCPPNSRARKERLWNLKELCTTCAAPHSYGHFLSNWTLSASVCHQPDLADLHGVNLSPAAFKGSHKLMPMFSQSKPAGYNDILYPSAWNYMDKVKYDPSPSHPDHPFPEKGNTLFWRGATSEGVSGGTGAWKGMTRQRLLHLANNATHPQTILLPDPKTNNPAYTTLSPASLSALLNTSVHLVDLVRCGGPDCSAQAGEFGEPASRTDFQHHWRYRFLVDADGAGFSGRFLPFLQSRSVPFKTALFREWYEGRLTAWQHFVPLDLRLHGLWSALAYFAGVEGGRVKGVGKWEARVEEGERIGEQGKAWAESVLRKEDMEVYFFRLLLEWGRLTDDRRDELGFDVGGG